MKIKKISIENAIAEFNEQNVIKGLSQDTLRYYRQNLEILQAWLPKKFTIAKITEQLYNQFMLYMSERRENNISVNTTMRAIKRFFNFCVENNYCVAFKMQLKKAEEKIKPTLTLEQSKILIANKNRTKGSIATLLLFATGIRSKTLRNLKVKDINFVESTIFLSALKDRKQNILPMPAELLSTIADYIKINQLQNNDYLIPNKSGNPYDQTGLYKIIKRHMESIGINTVGVHMFRHTFSKFMIANGSDSISLMHWLCHKTVGQSEHYVDIYGKELKINMEKYNPYLVIKNFL